MNDRSEQFENNHLENTIKPVLSVDEKLKLVLNDKPVFKTPKHEDVSIENHVTNCFTQEGHIGSINVTGENCTSEAARYENMLGNKTMTLKGKKIFKIKKYVKYNKFLSEICSDEELSEKDKKELKDPKNRKISPFSKVNFSKLCVEEKDERLKNLALLVKRLRRKVRNLEHKVRFNATKLLNKHLWNKLGINTKNKYLLPEFQFDFDKICKALKRIRNYDNFEYSDEKHLIENTINLIAEDKLKFDSVIYKKICTLIRRCISKEKIKHLSKKNPKNVVSFPETDVYISSKEYQSLFKYKDNEEITRAILGVEKTNVDSVIAVPVEEPEKEVQDTKPNTILANLLLNNTNNSLFANPSVNSMPMPDMMEVNRSVGYGSIPGISSYNNIPNINNFTGMSHPMNISSMKASNNTNPMNNIGNNCLNNNNQNPLNLWLLNNNPQMQSYLMSSLGLLGNSMDQQGYNNMSAPNFNTPQNLLNMSGVNRGYNINEQNINMFLK